MLIKAAINGGRSKDENRGVPVTPDEQAGAAVESLKAGANAVHLHVRSTSGTESLFPEDVARTLETVLAVCRKTQIGVSTGAWILPETAERLQAVAAWEILPGFASVNFGEDGAAELAELLISKGVEIEAGLCDASAAEIFCKSGLPDRCLRVLLEPQEQEMELALRTVNEIESVLRSAPAQLPRLLHGTEATAWPIMKEAVIRGYGGRIGFEDTLVMPDGKTALSNAELVTEAVRRCETRREPGLLPRHGSRERKIDS